jgi:hypothetical protein
MKSTAKTLTAFPLRMLLVGLLVVLIVFFATRSTLAADREFSGVVRAIESHYGVHRTHIPLLGFGLLFVHTGGVSGLKLAIFENFHPRADRATDDVRDVVEHYLGSDWHLFVHTRSRADGENTLIYTNVGGNKMQMLVISLESDEATVVQMNLSEGAMRHWMREPGEHGKGDLDGHHGED